MNVIRNLAQPLNKSFLDISPNQGLFQGNLRNLEHTKRKQAPCLPFRTAPF